MESKALITLFAGSLLALSACGGGNNNNASPAQNTSGFAVRTAPATINIMQHSSCCYSSDPFLATESLWHAFFEAPATPTAAVTETTDLTTLNNFHMLYIDQAMLDALSPDDMAMVRDWTNAGGILAINEHNSGSGASAFGAFLGASYAFTSIAESDGDTIVVTNATHRLMLEPNRFDGTVAANSLSNWGSSVHGAFSAVGSAYTCLANNDDGVNPAVPVLCAAPYGQGAIILTGFDPECGSGCHDDHLTGGTASGSELWENFLGIIYAL